MKNQLTFTQAQEIAAKAAERSTGFDKIPADDKAITINGKDLRRVLEASAMHALDAAGCLQQDAREDKARITRLANEATSQHDRWKQAHGG